MLSISAVRPMLICKLSSRKMSLRRPPTYLFVDCLSWYISPMHVMHLGTLPPSIAIRQRSELNCTPANSLAQADQTLVALCAGEQAGEQGGEGGKGSEVPPRGAQHLLCEAQHPHARLRGPVADQGARATQPGTLDCAMPHPLSVADGACCCSSGQGPQFVLRCLRMSLRHCPSRSVHAGPKLHASCNASDMGHAALPAAPTR